MSKSGSEERPQEELRAALAARQELGPEYESAIVESFIERADQAIDARIDARLDERLRERLPDRPDSARYNQNMGIAVGTGFSGFLATAAISGTMGAEGMPALILLWAAIAAINIAHAISQRPRPPE